METKQEKIKAWLRKRWMPLAIGSLGLLLLLVLAAGSIRSYQASTPIASIEPEDTVNSFKPPSRLDRYKKEMEEINRQQARRQRSMETIISMDFGELGRDGEHMEVPAEAGPKDRRKPEGAEAKVPAIETKTSAPSGSASRTKQAPPNKMPEAVKEKSEADPFYTVRATAPADELPDEQKGLFKAVIHGDQKLQPNAMLSLRLLEEISVGGHHFPRNTLLYGRLSGTGGGRLKVRITSIESVPVRMSVYDQDYGEGIAYLQEEALPSALDDSRDDALNSLLYTIPYGGVAGSIAGLGRNILRKSRKGRPVLLADGYPLFVAPDNK